MFGESPPLPSVTEDDEVLTGKTTELSFAQEQIWLDEQITPGTPAYNIPLAIHFKGIVDADLWMQPDGDHAST